MSETGWLIEAGDEVLTTYYRADGDWCSNPNHARRFPTREAAAEKAGTMTFAWGTPRVAEHMWG